MASLQGFGARAEYLFPIHARREAAAFHVRGERGRWRPQRPAFPEEDLPPRVAPGQGMRGGKIHAIAQTPDP